MCRHTLASIGAFLTFDNLAEIVKSYLRSANVNKCSHNGSNHIPEEAVCRDAVPLRPSHYIGHARMVLYPSGMAKNVFFKALWLTPKSGDDE